jgi:Uma2 family endonuclease
MVSIIQKLADEMPDARRFESDEPEMESSLHYLQLMVLVASLELLWRDRTDYFLGANLTVYFSRKQLKNRDFRGPDLFLVQDTTPEPRKSWVVWEEDGKYPDLIIELLSDSTAEVDRKLKKQLYQNSFHTHEYFWFSPDTLEFQGSIAATDPFPLPPTVTAGAISSTFISASMTASCATSSPMATLSRPPAKRPYISVP